MPHLSGGADGESGVMWRCPGGNARRGAAWGDTFGLPARTEGTAREVLGKTVQGKTTKKGADWLHFSGNKSQLPNGPEPTGTSEKKYKYFVSFERRSGCLNF